MDESSVDGGPAPRAEGFSCAEAHAAHFERAAELVLESGAAEALETLAEDGLFEPCGSDERLERAAGERMFEPFFSTKDVGKGTGMGLATVHGIVHEHGGHVLVETALGAGSLFRVLLVPLADAESAVERRPDARRGVSRRPTFRGRVLVVDDEEAVGEFMRELLESWGLEVVFLPRPAAALALMESPTERFDLVITDQTMPQMSELELTETLHAIRADLPVVLYTGYGDGLGAEALRAAGVCAVLAKPVDPQRLAAALAAHLPTAAD